MALPKASKSQLSVCFWFLEVFIAYAAISFLIYLCLIPKYPVCTIANAYIPALGLNSTLAHASVTRNTSVVLEISNPNKGMSIHYDAIHITLDFNGSIIGNGSLPRFFQGYRMQNRTRLDVLVSSHQRQLWSGRTGAEIDIRARLETSVKFKYKIFGTETKYRRVQFQGYVPIGLRGRMAGNRTIELQTQPEALQIRTQWEKAENSLSSKKRIRPGS